jgi:predicted TIM-barrel fold metal-dependent hydrolase
VYSDHLLQPWYRSLREALPELRVFDPHTHVGGNDPSGFLLSSSDLLDALELADARAATFALKEPGGYRQANREVIELADQHPERLIAFCRLDPSDGPVEEAERCLELGARGIKLHPSGDEFDVDDSRLEGVWALADSERLPVILHAGPELGSIGASVLAIAERFPGVRLILAHGAIPDLAWIWREAPDHPNIFFDSSWWNPSQMMALFALIPPGQILGASDAPYCTPLSGAHTAIRCGLQAGLDEEQLTLVMGGQFERLLDGADPLDAGPAPEPTVLDPSLERIYVVLCAGLEALQRGDEIGQLMDLARHGCRVADEDRNAELLGSITDLLDLYEQHHEELETGNQYAPGWDLISAAAVLARTPAVPVPATAPVGSG